MTHSRETVSQPTNLSSRACLSLFLSFCLSHSLSICLSLSFSPLRCVCDCDCGSFFLSLCLSLPISLSHPLVAYRADMRRICLLSMPTLYAYSLCLLCILPSEHLHPSTMPRSIECTGIKDIKDIKGIKGINGIKGITLMRILISVF